LAAAHGLTISRKGREGRDGHEEKSAKNNQTKCGLLGALLLCGLGALRALRGWPWASCAV